MDTKDPLSALISEDVKAADRKKLAELLKPFIEIDGTTQEFNFLPAFSRLKNNEDKLEILLAAVKARALLFDSVDGLLPKEAIALDVMPLGSTKTVIKRLYDTHRIRKGKDGRYFLPNHRMLGIIERFENGQGKTS